MTAIEFIQKFGWFTAKEYLAGATIFDNHLIVFTDADDLKRCVDAWELIESKGGLEKAKKHYLDMREVINQVYYSHSCDFKSQQLKQAITLVEEVDNK